MMLFKLLKITEGSEFHRSVFDRDSIILFKFKKKVKTFRAIDSKVLTITKIISTMVVALQIDFFVKLGSVLRFKRHF